MRTMVTSKEEILASSRQLICRQGWSAINIRSVANACGVSVGAIYNYFGSKTELVGATVESIWCDIFCRPDSDDVFASTLTILTWIYRRMEYGARQYPGFFALHPIVYLDAEQNDGRQRMQQSWQHIKDVLCDVMEHDPHIRPDAFTAEFTMEGFADLLFSLIVSALIRGEYDPSAVLETVRRTLYA